MTDLPGRKASAMGARGGLGATIARQFAVRNAHVAVGSRNGWHSRPGGWARDRAGNLMMGLDDSPWRNRAVACCPRRGARQVGSLPGPRRATTGAGK